ncbi:protein FATTY ACID EXPORT 4 chloroplastic [Prunus yedoensis var. nudiflora]|uniref:Protein FATTY ACID EXPORT 4 chloroplastic n=1 Tax=Prunus yedoensis var. nudiflora TaxID=2094558 RepID=A0A314XQG0_PRUYE|nr:protein FATTY ACID EXPORT 4 chloroplastic [Prunus yedoensis var. nudiflora]
MSSSTLHLASAVTRRFLYERNPRIPSSKSPAFSNPHPYHCNYNAGNGKLAMNNAGFKTKPKTQRRRFLCTSQLAEYAPTTSTVYGFLLLSGGLFAYARSGSKGSILGGVSGAALMGTAYYLMQTPETKAIGDALGFGSAFLFASVFGIRLAATRKLAPAGPLLALSLSALAVFISAYLQDSH